MSMITGGGSSSSSSVTKKWCKFRDVCLNNMHSLRFAEYWGPVFICRPYRAGRMPSWLLFLRKRMVGGYGTNGNRHKLSACLHKGSRIWTSPDANKQTLRNSRLPIFRGFWDGLLLDTSTYRTPVNMHRYSSACPVSCNKSDSVVVHRSYPLLDHFFVSWPHCSFCRHVRVQLQCRHLIRHKPQITFKFFLYEWIRGKCLAPCPWFMADQENSGGLKGCHPNL